MSTGFTKNTAGQKWLLFCFSPTTSLPLSGETSITCSLRKDNGGAVALTNSVSEIGQGYYEIELTQAETDADVLDIIPTSSASRVIVGVPGRVFTQTVTNDALNTAIATVDNEIAALPATIADAVWDEPKVGHAVADTFGAFLDQSISSTTTGGVTADAIADAVWSEVYSAHTGVTGSAAEALSEAASVITLDAAGVRSALGMAAANLDSQLSTIDNAMAVVDSEVGSIQTDVTAILEDTGTTLPAEIAASGISQADVRNAIGLASANLDTQLSTIDTEIGVIDGIVDDIKTTVTTHDTLMTSINNNTTSNFSNITAILGDTHALQQDWAVGGRLDLLLDAAAAPVLDPADIRTALGMASANLDSQLALIPDILADTETMIPATITVIDTEIEALQTDVTAILEDTQTTLDAAIATVQTDVSAILEDTGVTLPATLAVIDSEIELIDTVADGIAVQTTSIESKVDLVDTVVDRIEVDTIAIEGKLDIVDTNVDDIETATTAAAIRAAVGLANADMDAQFSNIGGNLGNGAHTVTITVQEDAGSTPIGSATVRATFGSTSLVGSTDASGQCVFALDTADWDFNVTAVGYSDLVSQTLSVNSTTNHTYQLTLTATIPGPATPNVATGTLTAFDESGAVEAGVDFTVKLTAGPGVHGQSHDTASRVFTSDATGLVTVPGLVRNATYSIQRSSASTQSFVVPDADSFTIPVVGLLGFE